MKLEDFKNVVSGKHQYFNWDNALQTAPSSELIEISDEAAELYKSHSVGKTLEKVEMLVEAMNVNTSDHVLSVPSTLPISELVEGKLTPRQFIDALEEKLKSALKR